MKIKSRRKFNVKNCYIIIITTFAIVSFGANLFQNHFYNKALQIQQETITELASYNSVDVMDNN